LSREKRCSFFWVGKHNIAATGCWEDTPFELLGLSNWRCWIVDFRSEDDRFGMVLKYEFVGGRAYRADQSNSSKERLSESPLCGSDSNMLKSEIGPWTLRLFAEGLPKPNLSLLSDASVLFIGLAVDDFEPKLPLIRFSAREVVTLGAVMKSIISSFSLSMTSENASFV
jgi:hypothetical protein